MTSLSPSEIRLDPSSYADPNGFLFHREGRLYRALTRRRAGFYRSLFEEGLIPRLAAEGRLVGSRVSDLDVPELDCPLVVEHERIDPVSYCVEWCPSMLRAAAASTLELAALLAERGLLLQDAHPWNLVFDGARPVFVDMTSIVPAEESPLLWPAYQQFLSFFLYPLELSAMGKGREARALLADYVRGVSEGDLARNMTARYALGRPLRWLKLRAALWAQRKVGGDARLKGALEAAAASPALAEKNRRLRPAFFRGLHKRVASLPAAPRGGAWLDYRAGEAGSARKLGAVSGILDRLRPRSVLDLGCNTGEFSLLAAGKGAAVAAMDSDESCVEVLFERARASGLKVLPLVADVLNPTPAFGFLSAQFPSLLDRARSETVLCLGLMHHLHVTGLQPLERIADLLARLASRSAVLEFVASDDEKVALLRRGRDVRYGLEDVRRALGRHFRVETLDSDRPTRKLLVCEKL